MSWSVMQLKNWSILIKQAGLAFDLKTKMTNGENRNTVRWSATKIFTVNPRTERDLKCQ